MARIFRKLIYLNQKKEIKNNFEIIGFSNSYKNPIIDFSEPDKNFSSTNRIPKIIIQTWKGTDIPEKYYNDMFSLKMLNPDYEFLFFTDEDIENFLKNIYPNYYESYKKLRVKIQKIDYFRYIAIYHSGGFYFDLDITGLHNLDELLGYDCIFPVDQNIKNCDFDRNKTFCTNGLPWIIGQYAFASTPKHEFIKQLIDSIHNNVDEYVKQWSFTYTDYYVYITTGPDFVTMEYLKYNDKNKIKILEYPENQYFGKYAKHNCLGTWK